MKRASDGMRFFYLKKPVISILIISLLQKRLANRMVADYNMCFVISCEASWRHMMAYVPNVNFGKGLSKEC